MTASKATASGKEAAAAASCDGRQGRSQSRQYLASFVVNILSFVSGSTYGWMAPMLPVLQGEDSPLGIPPVSDTDASWLASIPSMSRLLTIPLYGLAMDRLGHKATGYLIAAPFIVGWLLLLFANSLGMLFWSRIITGLAYGGIAIFVPSYTIDIAEDSVKGRLGVLFALSMNIGCTFAYVMGSYTSYAVFHWTHTVIPVIFIVAFFWMPESPLFLMTAGKAEEAKDALRWLRNGEDSEFELNRIQFRAHEILEERKRKISFKIITDRFTWRALLICVGLILNQQLCGPAPITSYTLTIFRDSGSTIPASAATIMIGALQTVGSFMSSVTIERFGRRALLISGDVVMATCLATLGLYLYLRALGWDVAVVGWLPVACLSAYILGMGAALGPLPFMLATEMVTPQARSVVQSVCIVTVALSTFGATFSFVPLVALVGQHGCFLLYALVCVVGAVCVFLTVPETKNRSIEEVVEQLKSDRYVRSVLRGRTATPDNTKQKCST
ncbi:facilitated trehalose transporter Tret1-like isoform X2 [Bacillus rossius redtenbacheri]|uniref:facilitated trehalose transporter Tret1-like isoform X2 n=1 Tax=Bacillus rossius redtenbacheri TaxID=93214 RepID=UPI002FDC7CAC